MFRLGLVLLPLCLVLGCDDTDDKEDTDDGFIDPNLCPQDYEVASESGLTMNSLSVGGIAVAAAYDPDAEYDGAGASACMNEDSTSAIWIVESAGEPFLVITVTATSTGSFDPNASDASLTIEFLEGTEAGTVLGAGDYTQANWNVSETGQGTVATTFNGTALGGRVQTNFIATMTQ